MKTLFIPAKSNARINSPKILEISKKLPRNIAVAYSIQYKEIAEEIRKILSKTNNITKFTQVLGCLQPLGCSHPLGCLQSQFPKNTQAILLISDGKFHAVSLAVESNLPVYLFNQNDFRKVSEQEIQILKNKQKAGYLKFLNADKVGILISTKPGQENFEKAIKFKKQQTKKKSYLFIGNEINSLEFENFPQIQSWVNTACPRLDMNSDVVNLRKPKSIS